MARASSRTESLLDSRHYLMLRLERLDMLIRAQAVRWRMTVAAGKSPELLGLPSIGNGEIDAYLAAPFVMPGDLPPGLEGALAPLWAQAAAMGEKIGKMAAATPDPDAMRLLRLRRDWGLAGAMEDALLVALLAEIDQRYRRVFAWLMDDASRTLPTVELIAQIIQPSIRNPALPGAADPAVVRALFDPVSSPLLTAPLLVLGESGAGGPLAERTVRIDPRIADFLLGGDQPDHRIHDLVDLQPSGKSLESLCLSDETLERIRKLAGEQRCEPAQNAPWILATGAAGSGKRLVAEAICQSAGLRLLVARADRLLQAPCGFATAIDLIYREARLSPGPQGHGPAVYWEGVDALLADTGAAAVVACLLDRAAGETVARSLFGAVAPLAELTTGWRRRVAHIDLPLPDQARRQVLWRNILAGDGLTPEHIDLLAAGFQLTAGRIGAVVAETRALADRRRGSASAQSLFGDLLAGCRQASAPLLGSLARRVEIPSGLTVQDLVLPPASRRQFADLMRRVRLRGAMESDPRLGRLGAGGRGLIALFTGSSGTGKTMAASVLAQAAGVALYRIDLSALVSKYIGETEKNLSHIFGEAEAASAILFFDEADALFGKRGEVKEARDRWANLEVNYLLQRIEDYDGVVILATNLRQNIDVAFMRRIQVVMEFPFPDARARIRVWRDLLQRLPAVAPDVDVDDLANRFALSGAAIRNVTLDAFFRALDADAGRPVVAARHIAGALSAEYVKMGKPINVGEWGEALFKLAEADD